MLFAQCASRARNARRSSRGQSLVELALALPFLILVLVGVLDLGRLLNSYVVITNAAREGARYGIDHPADTPGIQDAAEHEGEDSGIEIDSSKVTVLPSDPALRTTGTPITVTVSYDHKMILTYIFAGLQTIPIKSGAVMQVK